MLAAHYRGDRMMTVDDVTPRPPGPGEVEIDVAYTGICGTDLHVLHGSMDSRVTLPAVIGHEMSGRIRTLGDGVTGWSVGDPVTVMPLAWCGTCPACGAGHQHVCQNLEFIGIDSTGAMQARWTVSASVLVALPPGLSLKHAALVEPTAVAVHDVRRAALAQGEKVVVVGGGPVGLLVAAVAASAGGDVVVVELDERRRALIRSFGLRALDPGEVDVAADVLDWTGGAGATVTFEVSGSQGGLDTAIDVLSVRGRMVLVAIHAQPRPVSLHRIFWRELTVLGARVYERPDFERAVELINSGVIPVGSLISRIEPLDNAPAAFAALEAGGEMKVLIECSAS